MGTVCCVAVDAPSLVMLKVGQGFGQPGLTSGALQPKPFCDNFVSKYIKIQEG